MASRKITIDVDANTGRAQRDLRSVDRAVDAIGTSSSRAGSFITTMLGTFSGVAIAQAAITGLRVAFDAVAAGITSVLERGAQLAPVQASFRGLTESIGGADVVMRELRAASSGLVTDLDLMLSANKALNLGIPASAEGLGRLSEAAITLGRSMGLTATQSVNDLITGIGRMSPLILDNLGLTVNASEAYDVFAAAVGTTAANLTEAEKKQAFYNATVAAAEEAIASLGEVQLTMANRWEQVVVQVQNFAAELGAALQQSDVFAAGMAHISTSIEAAFGTDTQALIATTVERVESFVIAVLQGADLAIGAFQGLFKAWTFLPALFLEFVLQPIIDGNIKIGEVIASTLEWAAQLPGALGKPFAAVAVTVREGVAALQGWTSAIDSGLGRIDAMNSGMSATRTELQGLVAAMQTAQATEQALISSNIATATSIDAIAQSAQIATVSMQSLIAAAGGLSAPPALPGVVAGAGPGPGSRTGPGPGPASQAGGGGIFGGFGAGGFDRSNEPFFRPGGYGFQTAGPGVYNPFSSLPGIRTGTPTVTRVTVNAQGAIFDTERTLDRLADLIAQRMTTQGRLGAIGGAA